MAQPAHRVVRDIVVLVLTNAPAAAASKVCAQRVNRTNQAVHRRRNARLAAVVARLARRAKPVVEVSIVALAHVIHERSERVRRTLRAFLIEVRSSSRHALAAAVMALQTYEINSVVEIPVLARASSEVKGVVNSKDISDLNAVSALILTKNGAF